MSDPFLPAQSSSQLIREARVGLTVMVLVIATVGFWSWNQYRRIRHSLPDHVRNAPIATHVGPDQYLSYLEAEEQGVAVAVNTPIEASRVVSRTGVPVRPATKVPRIGLDRHMAAVPRENHPIFPPGSKPLSAPQPITVNVGAPDSGFKPLVAMNPETPQPTSRSKRKTDSPTSTAKQLANTDQGDPAPSLPEIKNPVAVPVTKDLSNDLTEWKSGSNKPPISNQPDSPQPEVVVVDPQVSAAGHDFASKSDFQSANSQSADSESAGTQNSTKESTANPKQFQPKRFLPPRITETQQIPSTESQSQQPKPDPATAVRGNPNLFTPETEQSLWSIAQQVYGDGQYFRALHRHNERLLGDKNKVEVGLSIETPHAEALRERYPELCPPLLDSLPANEQIYTTKPGDTLFDIARQELGQASRYLELLKINRDRLAAGIDHRSKLPGDLRLILPR